MRRRAVRKRETNCYLICISSVRLQPACVDTVTPVTGEPPQFFGWTDSPVRPDCQIPPHWSPSRWTTGPDHDNFFSVEFVQSNVAPMNKDSCRPPPSLSLSTHPKSVLTIFRSIIFQITSTAGLDWRLLMLTFVIVSFQVRASSASQPALPLSW